MQTKRAWWGLEMSRVGPYHVTPMHMSRIIRTLIIIIDYCSAIVSYLSLLRSYRKEDSCCLDTWSEWMSQPTPGEFWLQFPRVIGEGQLDDPTPPGWLLWRTTYLCTTSPMRMLSKWPWISRCGDYWQQVELRTDGACRIMIMMICNFLCIAFSVSLLTDN